MGKPRMSKARPETCAVPDCTADVKTRGLCVTHYWRARKGRESDPRTAEARKYLAPYKRQRRAGPVPATPATGPAAEEVVADAAAKQAEAPSRPRPAQRSAASGGRDSDTIVSTVCEFATLMGLTRIPMEHGNLFVNVDRDNMVVLTEGGYVKPARLELGAAAALTAGDAPDRAS